LPGKSPGQETADGQLAGYLCRMHRVVGWCAVRVGKKVDSKFGTKFKFLGNSST